MHDPGEGSSKAETATFAKPVIVFLDDNVGFLQDVTKKLGDAITSSQETLKTRLT